MAAPGFINFRLSDGWLARQVDAILAQGARFGDVPLGEGQRVQVEFVSANPVGPLHVGAGRGLAIGDTLASVLAAAGYEAEREYSDQRRRHADGDLRRHPLRSLSAALRARGGDPRGRLPRPLHD